MPQLPEDRQARLDAIGQQIAAGTYETHDKLEVAVERLLRVLEADACVVERLDDRPRQPR